MTVPAAGAGAASPFRIGHATVGQKGRDLVLTVRTSGQIALKRLARYPDMEPRADAHVCFELSARGAKTTRRLCVGGRKRSRHAAGIAVLGPTGKTRKKGTAPIRVKRPSKRKLVISLLPGKAGLTPGKYRWRAVSDSGRCGRANPRRCSFSLPAEGRRSYRIRPVRVVGCTGGSAQVVTHGPTNRKVVALTFDDGPSDYTASFLKVLREKHVNGTFFQVGDEVASHPASIERKILAQGNEIGNHSTSHSANPGRSDLAHTSALIERATHFKPCLFRPPYGSYNSSVVGGAAAAGMKTILWSVDPQDWSTPGTGAIYTRITSAARPGSIILMHDGGGPRGQTLAALPSIIDNLRGRGYKFKTVSELLGNKLIYRPYG